MTVKEVVARLIVGNSEAMWSGISNWDIETAHPDHQLTGLRKIRYLREDYIAYCKTKQMLIIPKAYWIRGNRYVFGAHFIRWLETIFLPSLAKKAA